LTRRNIPEGFTVRSSIKVFNVSNKIWKRWPWIQLRQTRTQHV
jgi:hypothetical protein